MDELEQVRREAVRILCDAHARDRLPLEAFETRLERIKEAPNVATLEAIVADLDDGLAYPPVPIATASLPALATDPELAPVRPAEFLRLSSVLASTKRAGAWTVPLELHGLVILGDLTLDLRDAVFGSDVVDIEVHVTFGSFKLIVPAGTQVENEITETLSSSTHSTRSARGARPNGLLVRVRGGAFCSSVEIQEKYPTGTRPTGGLWQKLLGGQT